MTTREALAAVTDRGDFESLATAVLRVIEPDCAAVIHHGLNAKGEPVKGPVDAWCRVPESHDPRFVVIAHTTTDRSSLRGKWIGTTGDIAKAAAHAQGLKTQFPKAKFRLFLTTNFVPESTLQADVYSMASAAGLEAIIVDQTRLADYLDTPNGQYLRRKFLGIEADSLSKELFTELSCKSAESHAQRFLSGEIPVRVERETDDQVRTALGDSTVALLGLIADAGFGKSTTANLILTEHIRAGGYGLWVSESVLRDAVSIENAISRTLCSLHPALSSDTASAWFTFCGGQRLLLLVDDINSAADRNALLRKLRGWTAPRAQNSDDHSSRGFVVLCPVWTHVWEAARDPNKNFSWVSTISLGPMQPTEAAAAIQELAAVCHRILTNEQARECAEKLNYDPYLVGIFGVLLQENETEVDPVELTRDALRKYLQSALRNATSRCDREFTEHDFEEALTAVATQMLLHKDLRPKWSRVRTWLGESANPQLQQAAEFLRRDAVVCWLTGGDELVFRHDRLMQHLLAKSISRLYDCDEVVGEVFYAELLGQSLVTEIVTDATLSAMVERNPLALFEAIRAMQVPSAAAHEKIIDSVKRWVRSPEMPNEMPAALLFAVGTTLMGTDSQIVLEITRYLPPDYTVLAASLRHGSALAGACLLGEIGRVSFEPSVRHTWLGTVLAHAFRKHRLSLLNEIRELQQRPDLTYEQALGTILLSGYLAEPCLADGIVAICSGNRNPEFLLPEAIWAVGRCCGQNAPAHLAPLLRLLENLSDEKVEKDWSRRDGVRGNLHDFPADTFHPDAVSYIIEVADERPELRDLLLPLIHALDIPDAFEHLARSKAEAARARGKDEVNSLDFVFSKWDRTNRERYGRPSGNSRARLRLLWQSESEDRLVRSAAFKIWSWSADEADITHLQLISVESPLFRSALWRRAELGDRSCIPELARCLQGDVWLANIAHHVWSPALFSVADGWLARLVEKNIENADYVASCFGDLLAHIPAEDGERLLTTYWRGLREYHAFVQAALLISSPPTLALADEAIRSTAVEKPFAHLAMKMNDLRQRVPDWSAAKFLRGLEPYLDLISSEDLWHYVLNCRWAGESEWCRKHIKPRLPDETRRQHFADDTAIASEIEAIAKGDNRWRFSKYAFETLLRNEADPRRIIDLAVAAFHSTPSIRLYTILAEAVAELGNRSDLPLLAQPFDEEWKAAAKLIGQDARFRLCRRTLATAD